MNNTRNIENTPTIVLTLPPIADNFLKILANLINGTKIPQQSPVNSHFTTNNWYIN